AAQAWPHDASRRWAHGVHPGGAGAKSRSHAPLPSPDAGPRGGSPLPPLRDRPCSSSCPSSRSYRGRSRARPFGPARPSAPAPTRAPVRALLLAWVKKRIAAGQIVWYGPAGPAQDPYRSTRRPPPGPIIDATLEPTEERERERPDDAGQADGEDAPGGPPVPR